jgi:hypothetical protein
MEFRIIFSLQNSISINTFEVDPPLDSLHNAVVKPKNRQANWNVLLTLLIISIQHSSSHGRSVRPVYHFFVQHGYSTHLLDTAFSKASTTPKHLPFSPVTNPFVSFQHSKNICETLVHSSSQDSSLQNGTFPCRVAKCKTCDFIDSATTISAPKCAPPISSTASHAVHVACFILEKLEDL